MNENGYMITIISSFKVIFSKYHKHTFMNQIENRELVSLIEAISGISKQLPLFVILKKKR